MTDSDDYEFWNYIYVCVSLHGGVIWEGIILLGF